MQPVNRIPLNGCGSQFKCLMMSRMFTFRHERSVCMKKGRKKRGGGGGINSAIWLAGKCSVLCRHTPGDRRANEKRRWVWPKCCALREVWFPAKPQRLSGCHFVHEGSCILCCVASLSFTCMFWARQRCDLAKAVCEIHGSHASAAGWRHTHTTC